LIESTQSDGAQDDQAGNAGSVELKPRVSKLRAKGLSDYHSRKTVVEAARLGASGPNKKGYSHDMFTQKGELISSFLLDRKRAKSSSSEKKHHE
jgi:hypothetical protein